MDVELGKMRDRGVRHERGGRDLVGNEVDGNMGNIKMTIQKE